MKNCQKYGMQSVLLANMLKLRLLFQLYLMAVICLFLIWSNYKGWLL